MTTKSLAPLNRSTTWLAILLLILIVAAIIPQRPVKADNLPLTSVFLRQAMPCAVLDGEPKPARCEMDAP
ncbi:MAG: hypothetical protein AAF366_04140 [Pseudomonadota bacterium]